MSEPRRKRSQRRSSFAMRSAGPAEKFAFQIAAPAMRPLWMTFPEDVAGHRNDRQFMFGDALLVTPVLTQGARSVEGHFPPGTWYSLWNASDVVHAGCAALGIQWCVRV